MNCPKCGATLQANAKFCKFCGTGIRYISNCQYGDNISNSPYDSSSCHTQQYNYSYNYSNKTKPSYNLNQSHEEQYNYNNLYSGKFDYIKTETIGDERYLEVYVGPNYKIIKNGKFSISTLIFGVLHLLYRKLYAYSFLYLFIVIAAAFLIPSYYEIIYWGLNIIMAIKFNNLYMEHVEKKVEQIKQSNFDKTSRELLDECKKKGGVSLKSAILTPIIVILLIIIASLAFYGTKIYNKIDKLVEEGYQVEINGNENGYDLNVTNPNTETTPYEDIPNEMTDTPKTQHVLNGLTYKIQTNFIPNHVDDNYSIYTEPTNLCEIHFMTETKTINEFYNLISSSVTKKSKTNINNNIWNIYYTTVNQNDINYYVHSRNNKLYIVQTRNTSNNLNCVRYNHELINSLEFNY